MDYDKSNIAATYDAARSYPPEVLQQWLDLVAACAPSPLNLIVDLGCGTGRFTQPLSDRLDAEALGLDPSERMLAAARSKGHGSRVEFQRLHGGTLPLGDGSADMVFMSMVLHHLPNPSETAQECWRVLRLGGRLCVRNSTAGTDFSQRRFFPSAQRFVDQTLPSKDFIRSLFEGAGFKIRAHELVMHRVAAHWHEFADKLALRADSFLARIADAEFEAGMATLRTYAATRSPHEQVTEMIDFFVFER
ncbi:MAG: class I SAM-dependent methyltransferase [Hyphomicrobiaceae bacterium]